MNPYSVLATQIERKQRALAKAIKLAEARYKLAALRTRKINAKGRYRGGERAAAAIVAAKARFEGFQLALNMIDTLKK